MSLKTVIIVLVIGAVIIAGMLPLLTEDIINNFLVYALVLWLFIMICCIELYFFCIFWLYDEITKDCNNTEIID